MSQFVLLNTYVGASEFEFRVTCTGRQLKLQEAKDRGLVTDDQLRRFAKSNYQVVWYEVKPGEEIAFEIFDAYQPDINQAPAFVVPEGGLENPPVDLDRDFWRTGRWLHEYYQEHCPQKQ